MQKMTGENKELSFHKVNTVAKMGNGNIGNYKEIMFSTESKRVFHPSDSRASLIDILEELAR
jgi:hypothetical protein